MRETGMDGYDLAILDALQHDGSLTNAALGERVHLSASQCSRRRAALEKAGLIRGYAARLDAQKLGLGLRAITRVNLRAHGQGHEDDFTRFLRAHPQVHAAFSVSGDADYVLDIRVRRAASNPHNGWIEFAVTDVGTGIPPEVAEKLFTPFFTTRTEGMGLGLSMCRTVIEQHGGFLRFAPNEPHGTVFTFTLPVNNGATS